MKTILIFLDIPTNFSSHRKIYDTWIACGHEVTANLSEADIVIQSLRCPTKISREDLGSKPLMIWGDFSKAQTVPAEAICVDRESKMVHLKDGQVSLKQYLEEWDIESAVTT